jgi:hypothetical protein
MDINNFSSDENSIKDDFVEREFLPKQNEELKENQMNDSKKGKELANKVIFDEEFEKAFNNVFNQKSKELPEIDDDQIMNISPFIQEKIPEHKNFVPPPKEKIIKSDLEKKSKEYPFTKGIGLNETLKSIGLSVVDNSSSKTDNPIQGFNQVFKGNKFKTTNYYTDEKGKKKRKKKKRKCKPDDIRKKIKSRFHKTLKNIINTKLKQAGANKLFNFLPQSFIKNITIKLNSQSLSLTYEKLLEKDYSSEIYPKADRNKYSENMRVLNYLKENQEISEQSEFNRIKNMKYMDILSAYFSSHEFEQTIVELYNKKETNDYIKEYVNKAISYVNFFYNKREDETTSNNRDISSSEEDDNDEELESEC